MAFVEKRGPNRWRARHRGPDGREQSKTFTRRVDAERWLVTQRADLARGAWTDPALGRMTLEEWVGRWEPSTVDLRPTTRELNMGVLRKYLLPRFGAWPLAEIGTADVRAMVAEDLTGPLSNSAVRRHVLVLSTVLNGAVADGRIARNPCAGVKLPPEDARAMRFLEAAEVVTLANAVRPEHYRPLVLTAAFVGLRWGELAGLRADRVDLFHRQIRVDQQLVEVGGRLSYGPPKTKSGVRTVTLPAALVEVLAPHLAAEPVEASGLAFPTPSAGPMRRGSFRRTWRRACADAGFDPPPRPKAATTHAEPIEPAGDWPLRGLVFHELRHTAAALAIAQGAHPLAIRERLGHSSITVTMDRYGGLFPRLDEAIAEGLDGVLRDSLAAWMRPEPSQSGEIREFPQVKDGVS